jgi:TolB-like protein
MGSFFAELKRRHIYRVGAAYVVVAWVITQVVDVLSQVFALPSFIARPAIVLLVIGFPIALVAAWMIESKPHQAVASAVRSKTTTVDWTLIAALVLVIGLVSYQQLRPEQLAGSSQSTAIAVLPFANLSGDASQKFFSDGMAEEINAALAKVSGLTVLGRGSAFEEQTMSPRDLGRALNATHFIEGSVRKAGDQVRINARLVRTDNGVQLWSETYDRQLTDIFAIQEDIAQAIAVALRVPLQLAEGETLVSSRDIDPASYEQFLRARALVRARGTGESKQLADATALLEPIVARHPEFAPAWALLAQALVLTPLYDPAFDRVSLDEYDRVRDAFLARAEAAAERAVQLAPNQADGYVSLGTVQQFRRNWVLAEELYLKALALDPNNPDGLNQQSFVIQGAGRLKDALAMRQRLHALEPFVPRFNQFLADTLWLNGQNDDAITLMNSSDANDRPLRLAMIYAAAGRFSEAADVLSTAPAETTYSPVQVEAAARLLRAAPASAALPQSLPNLGNLGFVYFYIGAPERVLEELRGIPIFVWHPSYATLRKTQQFKEYVRYWGVVDYWRARGWPDLCRPVGADDFVCD